MAKKEKKKKSGAGKVIGVFLLIILCAVGLVAGFIAAWGATSRPSVRLYTNRITVEAGEEFDPATVSLNLQNTQALELEIDDSELDTDQVGDYKVYYRLTESEMEKIVQFFVRNSQTEDVLSVRVRDTTAPRLSVIEETPVVGVGTVLSVDELVTEVSDISQVTAAFEDGSTELNCEEAGMLDVKIVAEDEHGNVSSAAVTVDVKEEDTTPPVIQGAADTVIQIGESFDAMEGVSVTDNNDPNPSMTVSENSVNTAEESVTTLTYTAEDELGNRTTVTRKVIVTATVGEYNGVRYPVRWDVNGVVNQPYLVAVNRSLNVVTVYQQDAEGKYTVPVQAFLCSTGFDTPIGRFTTEERYRWQKLFEDAWGQYATRINGHILFHSVPYFSEDPADLEYEEFNKLGTSASLGCIRLCVADVKWIYDYCPAGFPCVIYDDEDIAGPLGTPEMMTIDTANETLRGWDPTDPDPANPYLASTDSATEDAASVSADGNDTQGGNADEQGGNADGNADAAADAEVNAEELTEAERMLLED